MLGSTVALAVAVDVPVAVAVGVKVAVAVPVGVNVAVAVAGGVNVAVGVTVGLIVGMGNAQLSSPLTVTDRNSIAWAARPFGELFDHYKDCGIAWHRYLVQWAQVTVCQVIRARVVRVEAVEIDL